MSTATIKVDNAIKAYEQADTCGKTILKTLFPDIEFEKPKNIMERVKTWGDVCKILSIDPIKSLPYQETDSLDQEEAAINAFFMLSKIRQVLNEGWVPDWTNSKEYKYYPWFENYKSGSGFSLSSYVGWHSDTLCGSRLCFKSRELCLYAVKQFEELYIDYYLM